TCEIVADTMGVRVIESGKVRKEIVAFTLESCRRMQPKIEERRPKNIGDGHQLEIVGRVLPKLRTGLYIRAQTGMPLNFDLRRGLVLKIFHSTCGEFFPGRGATRPSQFFLE